MTLSHIFVIVFMLLTAVFIGWLEMNSRKNTQAKEKAERQESENAGGNSR